MSTNQKIAVAGATGRVGHHVVDVLIGRGYTVVPISRRHGVDVITGEGLDEALAGVECIAKVAHERTTLSGPIPARVLRAAQFHEFLARLVQWGHAGRRCLCGEDAHATDRRAESLVDMAKLLVSRRGDTLRVKTVSDPVAGEANESGVLVPGPGAILGGPRFAEWLDSTSP